MLICDGSTAFEIHKTKFFVLMFTCVALTFVYIFIFASFKVLSEFEGMALLLTCAMGFFIYLFYMWIQTHRDSKRRVLDNILCGEIVQLIRYLDAIINNPSAISPQSSQLNIKAIEKTLEKLIDVSPDIAMPIKSILDNTGIFKKTKKLYSLHKKIFTIMMIMPIIFIAYLLYTLVLLTENFGATNLRREMLYMNIFFFISMFFIAAMFAITFWYHKKMNEIISEIANTSFEHVDKLKELLTKLIDRVSEKTSDEIAIYLIGSYPHVIRKKKYSIIPKNRA